MHTYSLGDLALSTRLERSVSLAKLQLTKSAQELSSGKAADVVQHLRGDLTPLISLENALSRTDAFKTNIREMKDFLGTQQAVLGRLTDLGGISDRLASAPALVNGIAIDTLASEASSAFSSAVQALNSQIGGRAVFAGTAVDQPAIASSDDILGLLGAEVLASGAVTARDVETVVSAWFSDPMGYSVQGYLGAPASPTGVQVSDSDVIKSEVTGQNSEIMNYLSGLALAALVDTGILSTDYKERVDLLRLSGESLISVRDDLISLQARIGIQEDQLSQVSAEVETYTTSIELARAEITEVDSYKAAVNLQNAENQLESIFTITARLSSLSLTNYL